MNLIFRELACYILGAIPFSVILSRLILKKDIREVGSKNIGTSNAYRTGGAKFAFLIALLDIAKGVIAVKLLIPGSSLGIFMVALGQMFPIFLNFKGGKGVGVYIGALIGLDYTLGLIIMFSWLLITKIFNEPFISSLLVLIASFFISNNDFYKLLTILIIIIKHKDNIIGFVTSFNKNKKKNNNK